MKYYEFKYSLNQSVKGWLSVTDKSSKVVLRNVYWESMTHRRKSGPQSVSRLPSPTVWLSNTNKVVSLWVFGSLLQQIKHPHLYTTLEFSPIKSKLEVLHLDFSLLFLSKKWYLISNLLNIQKEKVDILLHGRRLLESENVGLGFRKGLRYLKGLESFVRP